MNDIANNESKVDGTRIGRELLLWSHCCLRC